MKTPKKKRKFSLWIKVILCFVLMLLPVYALGLSIFRWGYSRMHQQVISSQMAQLNLYAETLDSELQRIRSLQYDCINDEDILYLSNAYNIMNTFDQMQYMLRTQNRLQVMKNSSLCISNVTIHLPTVGKTIDTHSVESLNSDWERISNDLYSGTTDGFIINEDNTLQFNIQYPVFGKEGKIPRLVMEITLSNQEIQKILRGFGSSNDTGLVLVSADMTYAIEKNDNPLFLQTNFFILPEEIQSTKEIVIDNTHYQQTTVRLENFDLALISFVSTEYLFGYNRGYFLLFAAFSAVAIAVMIIFAVSVHYLIHEPLSALVEAFREIKKDNLDIRIDKKRSDEFNYVYESFNGVMDHLQELIEKVYQQKLLTQRAEAKQLQAQINPHFLYNGFFSIHCMAREANQEDIATFSQLLSQYYYYITRNALEEVSVMEEIQHAVTYLQIQNIRFSNRLKIEIDETPEQFQHLMVPRLIIQPLLENSFEHGLKNMLEQQISLKFSSDNNAYFITVQDNGTEMTQERLEELCRTVYDPSTTVETTALVNIHRRLRLHFGTNSGLVFHLTQSGSLVVTIQITL